MTGTVNINEFMNHLTACGLIIVDKKDYLNKNNIALENLRKTTLKQDWISFKEIISCKWFRVKSNSGLTRWIEAGIIHPFEWEKINKRYKVSNKCIKRLLKDPEIEKQII